LCEYKDDWKEFETILKTNNITNLYHFTDIENLDSIKKCGGLYSWDYCDQNNIEIIKPGGNEASRNIDMDKGLQNYVRLSFNKKPPMYWALKNNRQYNLVILSVDPSVIYWKSTKFSDENTTSPSAWVGNKLSDFENIKLELATMGYQMWNDNKYGDYKRFFQAEVLVEEHIPCKYITICDL
jgi:hypothetical protein